jgi:hypothetical protein
MAQTVIGIFDDASEAQTAMQELMEAGFSRNNIDLSTQNESDTTNDNESTDYQTNTDGKHEKQGGIMGFFSSLFGDDDDDRDRYSAVGERHSILTVHTQSEDEAERAADILDDAGAIDVNERAEQYRSGMTTGVSADPLSPIYGDTPHVTSEEQQNTGQSMEERSRQRSRIFDKSVDDTNRLREDRSWNNNDSMKRPDADMDAEKMLNIDTGYNTNYNRPVDPESDVTKR